VGVVACKPVQEGHHEEIYFERQVILHIIVGI
jgi:hypothetical protein